MCNISVIQIFISSMAENENDCALTASIQTLVRGDCCENLCGESDSQCSQDGKCENVRILSAGGCQFHFFCSASSTELSYLVGKCSDLVNRKLERGREEGKGECGEDGQRLPHRAWSCDCEKRLLRYLHRTPQTEEGFYLSVLWDWKRQQKVIS